MTENQREIEKIIEELNRDYTPEVVDMARNKLDSWAFDSNLELHDRLASSMLPYVTLFLHNVNDGSINADLRPSWLKEMFPNAENLGDYVMSFMRDMYHCTYTTMSNLQAIGQDLNYLAENNSLAFIEAFGKLKSLFQYTVQEHNMITEKILRKTGLKLT